MSVARSLGKIAPSTTALFLCDMQAGGGEGETMMKMRMNMRMRGGMKMSMNLKKLDSVTVSLLVFLYLIWQIGHNHNQVLLWNEQAGLEKANLDSGEVPANDLALQRGGSQ